MIKVLRRDIQEFLASVPSAVMFLLWPLLILVAIAPLKDGNHKIHAYVETYDLAAAQPDRDLYADSLAARLVDLPDVVLIEGQRGEEDIWEFMDERGADIALLWHDVLLPREEPLETMQAGGAWYAYIDAHSNDRYRQIETTLQLAHAGASGQDQLNEQSGFDAPTSGMLLSARDVVIPFLNRMGAGDDEVFITPPIYVIERNGPAPGDYSWLIPGVILIISTMITFILASSALIKERTASTIHMIIGHRKGVLTLLSKSLFPTLVGLASLLAMILFSHSAFGFSIRPGWPAILLVVGLCLFAVAFQGITVSALVRSELGAIVAATAYLIVIMLFGGMFFDIESGTTLASAIAALLPSAHIKEIWTTWFLSGGREFPDLAPLAPFFGLTATSFAAAIVAILRLRHSL